MKYVPERALADFDAAARKPIEIANAAEAGSMVASTSSGLMSHFCGPEVSGGEVA
jgi:hypothetical protein